MEFYEVNKLSEKHFTSIEIKDQELWEKLKKDARENKENISNIVFRMLGQYIDGKVEEIKSLREKEKYCIEKGNFICLKEVEEDLINLNQMPRRWKENITKKEPIF